LYGCYGVMEVPRALAAVALKIAGTIAALAAIDAVMNAPSAVQKNAQARQCLLGVQTAAEELKAAIEVLLPDIKK
jgi:hypothetical protein